MFKNYSVPQIRSRTNRLYFIDSAWACVFRALHQYDLALADYVYATELDMQFTNISSININKQSDLQIVRVPPQAELWEDLSINIEDCDNLNLSSEYIVNDNGEKERVWYWPQSDIRSIRFSGNPISTDFL